MPTHRLSKGKGVIQAIASLGRALGYSVTTEHPVESRAHAPAVDVAWFRDVDNSYPLMIFEIESAATNAMASNVAKVYGQAAERFERPLFFFHLVLTAGEHSSRLAALKGAFGTHNYRVYQLDAPNTGTELLCDVLSQHRRIRLDVDLASLLSALDGFQGVRIDRAAVIDKAISLGLRCGYVQALALRALRTRTRADRSLCLRLLPRGDQLAKVDEGYDTYVGQQWSTPIEVALCVASGALKEPTALNQLRHWQENGDGLTQIGPHFGLSYDYDQFLFCMAASIWAHVAAMAIAARTVARYVADQLGVLLDGMAQAQPGLSFYTAAWTLHVSASARVPAVYNRAKKLIDRRGGISPRALFFPPSIQSPEEDPKWPQFWFTDAIAVPPLNDFVRRRAARIAAQRRRPHPISLGLRALVVPEQEDYWAIDLVTLLAQSGSSASRPKSSGRIL